MDKKGKFERTVIILMVIALWMLAALNSYIPEKAEPAVPPGPAAVSAPHSAAAEGEVPFPQWNDVLETLAQTREKKA